MKRIVELLRMNQEPGQKIFNSKGTELPKVQTIDKYMEYRDDIRHDKTQTKMYTQLDREQDEAIEESIEEIMERELGIKTIDQKAMCSDGIKDEIYKTRFSNFLFSKVIICETCQTIFALTELIIYIIMYEIRTTEGVNYEKVRLQGDVAGTLCKISLLASIVMRYDVWFKWSQLSEQFGILDTLFNTG